MTASPDAVPLLVARIVDRPARWAPAGSFLQAYDGARRTLQVFNTAAVDQARLLELIEPHRPTLERYAGGPLVIVFYTVDQSRRHDLSTAALPEHGERHMTKPSDWKPDEGVALAPFDPRPTPGTRAKFFASEVHEGPVHFPIRTDLTVLSPDDPNVMTLGFTLREREGGPVGVSVDGKFHSPLLAQDDLWEGREILVPTLAGVRHAVVARDEEGTLCWRARNIVGNLVFDGDDRHCWTTSCAEVEPPGQSMPDPTKPIPDSEIEALFQHRDTWDTPGRKKRP